MRRFVVLAVLVPMMVLTVVACGDDEEETLTTEEFLDQGNAICAAAVTEIDAAAEEAFAEGDEPTPEAQVAFVDVAAPVIQDEIDDIEALNPPEDLQDDVDELVDAAQAALDSITEDPESIFAGDDPFVDADALALGIGLTECAGDSGDGG